MKAKAVLDVVIVFSLTLFLVALVGISPIGEWERQALNRFFIEYAVMIAVPLIILLVTRRNLAAYGISLHNPRYHLSIAATAFVPVVLGLVCEKTGSIAASTILHGLPDAIYHAMMGT